MSGICEYFGSMSFDDRAMRARLPGCVRLARQNRAEGPPLDARVADEVAAAMKDWARSSAGRLTSRTGSSR